MNTRQELVQTMDKIKVIGTERSLDEIFTESEVRPLFRDALCAGIMYAALVDSRGNVLWEELSDNLESGPSEKIVLRIEGEPVGYLILVGDALNPGSFNDIARLLGSTLQILLNNNLRRSLTTQIHMQVVDKSYEELVQINKQLNISQERYRKLAESLEEEVNKRTSELKDTYARLVQQEKMAAIGQLAAGMAHEINNPLGFIAGNLRTFGRYAGRIQDMMRFYHEELREPAITHCLESRIREKQRMLKLDAIMEDIDDLVGQSIDGTERIAEIVRNLREFSHVDERAITQVDMNLELEKTLNILSHEIPGSTRIIKKYGELPQYVCNPTQICQVFHNIIVNALQAKPDGLVLEIATKYTGDSIRIDLTDNGPGICEDIRGRVFEPFFTTKDVGKGMGLGLAVAYDVISGLHGSIEIEKPTCGSGASFRVILPIEKKEDVKVRQAF